MANDDSRLLRILRLLAILNGQRPMNAAGLADRLGIGERTVYPGTSATVDAKLEAFPVTTTGLH